MEVAWVKIIKVTGSVGVIAFLIYYLMTELFSEKIIALFGGDKLFILVLIIISVLAVAIIIAIKTSKSDSRASNKSVNITYKDKSTHKGDNKF